MKYCKKEENDPNCTGTPNIRISQKKCPAKVPFPKKGRYSVKEGSGSKKSSSETKEAQKADDSENSD